MVDNTSFTFSLANLPSCGILRFLLLYGWKKTAVLGIILFIMEKESSSEKCILIIDDERPVREAVTDILEIEDIQVLTAANGSIGVEMYQKNIYRIGLVILDLSMPGMSGKETLAQLQAINPDVKVILSSGYSETDVSTLVNQQNHVGFLPKPYKIDNLLAKVAEFLI